MKILLTGASGFLGTAIQNELFQQHEVATLGRAIECTYVCDLAKETTRVGYADMVVHAAGKAHSVPKNEKEKAQFYKVNVTGTQNLLDSILSVSLPKTFVFISSVAVYGSEEGLNITEKHALTGKTPYAQSKIDAEQIVLGWGEKQGVSIVILRLPLISGTNPPGNLAAMAKAIRSGYYVRIGKGEARKSMVAAADVATLLPSLLGKSGVYNLCDGVNPSLMEIEKHIAKQVNKRVKSLPRWPLTIAAKVGDVFSFFPLNTARLAKLTSSLTFSDELARKELNWNPKPALNALKISHAQA